MNYIYYSSSISKTACGAYKWYNFTIIHKVVRLPMAWWAIQTSAPSLQIYKKMTGIPIITTQIHCMAKPGWFTCTKSMGLVLPDSLVSTDLWCCKIEMKDPCEVQKMCRQIDEDNTVYMTFQLQMYLCHRICDPPPQSKAGAIPSCHPLPK